jgi:exonuclease SbcD
MEALKTYLDNREDLKDITAEMMEAAQRLLARESDRQLDVADTQEAVQVGATQASQQLENNTQAQAQLRLL